MKENNSTIEETVGKPIPEAENNQSLICLE